MQNFLATKAELSLLNQKYIAMIAGFFYKP